MRKALISLVVGCSLSLALVPWAQAATTLHYSCTDGTSCTPGATTLVTGNTSPSFNITVQGLTGSTGGTDTLYIIVGSAYGSTEFFRNRRSYRADRRDHLSRRAPEWHVRQRQWEALQYACSTYDRVLRGNSGLNRESGLQRL